MPPACSEPTVAASTNTSALRQVRSTSGPVRWPRQFPSTGGFVAGSQELAIFLQHASSPYIFSAALSPASVAAIREGLSILALEPERVARIEQNANFLLSGLRDLGYDTGLSETRGHSRHPGG